MPYTPTHTHSRIYMHTHTHTHIQARAHIHTHILTHNRAVHKHTHTHTLAQKHTRGPYTHTDRQKDRHTDNTPTSPSRVISHGSLNSFREEGVGAQSGEGELAAHGSPQGEPPFSSLSFFLSPSLSLFLILLSPSYYGFIRFRIHTRVFSSHLITIIHFPKLPPKGYKRRSTQTQHTHLLQLHVFFHTLLPVPLLLLCFS